MNLGQHIAGRDLSLNDVARKTSLSVDRLTQIMEGDDASLAEMRRIARAIRVPMSILLDDEAREADAPFNVLLRQGLEQRNDDLESSMDTIAQQIRDVLTIAKNLPSNSSWLDLFRGLTASIDYAENFSAIFRRAFAALDDQDPYLFLGQTMDELGVLLCYARDARVDGVSAVVEGQPLVLLAARTFKPRMLFTLAHEVGHLVARHDLRDQNFARVDRSVLASEEEWERRRDDERFADAFASSLLMPQKGFLKLLRAVRQHVGATGALGDVEILMAARFFGVGFEAAARRCEQLGLLEARGARALYQKICDDFGNPERRAEALGLGPREDILISTSRGLIEEAVRLIREEKLSAGRAAELLNIPISMLFAANSG